MKNIENSWNNKRESENYPILFFVFEKKQNIIQNDKNVCRKKREKMV